MEKQTEVMEKEKRKTVKLKSKQICKSKQKDKQRRNSVVGERA